MRRVLASLVAFVSLTGVFLILPVYAAPGPQAQPVEPSIEELSLGSVVAPAAGAVVTTDGESVSGQPTGDADESTATTAESSATPDESAAATTAAPRTSDGPAATSTPGGPSTDEGSDSGDVVTSGDELPGVPALTISQPDTAEFSSAGITWAQDGITDVMVQLRVKDEDGNWDDWTAIDADDVEQSPTRESAGAAVRGGTAPYWTGRSYGIEVIVQGADGTVPADVKVALIDPGESPADVLAQPPAAKDQAHAASTMPQVYSRAQWGADESLRTWDPEYPATLKAATVHHTADRNDYSAEEVPAMMRSMYAYHTVTRGWGDIGYNVIVDRFGRMFEGRYGGLASTVIGAHAGGFNTYTFGVSMLGNYDTVPVPQATVDAVADIIAWKFSLYGIDPRGTTVLTSGGGGTAKYAQGVKVTLPTIFGHRDVGSTACPGAYGYARLDDIRNRVAGLTDLNMSAIEGRYLREPALRTGLGAAVGTEQFYAGVAWQEYANGRLYWSPATGVHLLRGAILGAYLAAGGPTALGAPTTDEGIAGQWGAFNHFSNDASIYWTADTGAQVVRGAIRGRWLALGAEWTVGFPTGPETPAETAGAVRSSFTGGDIYWSAPTGAHLLRGGIRAAWQQLGGATKLGLPTSDEVSVPGGGARSDFKNGVSLIWSPATGVQALGGGIVGTWYGLGAGASALGFPTGSERSVGNGGTGADFQDGGIYWSPATGAQPLRGPIDARFRALGGATALGFPLYPEQPAGAALWVPFTGNATIYWSAGTGAHVVLGSIRDRWRALGGEWGRLGLPTSDEEDAAGGRRSTFLGGAVYWSPASGAHAVVGGFGEFYAGQGGPGSSLGFPVTDEYYQSGSPRQDFTGGSLIYSTVSNTVQVVH